MLNDSKHCVCSTISLFLIALSYSFLAKCYNDLDKVPKANQSLIAMLKEENPTVANVLVDHLIRHNLGKQSKQYISICAHMKHVCSTD